MLFLYFADLWDKKVILLLPSPTQTQVFLEEKEKVCKTMLKILVQINTFK